MQVSLAMPHNVLNKSMFIKDNLPKKLIKKSITDFEQRQGLTVESNI